MLPARFREVVGARRAFEDPDGYRVQIGFRARVARPGARFTGSSFARDGSEETGLRGWLWRRWSLHFVPVERLARELGAAGFGAVDVQMAGAWFCYASGCRASGSASDA